MRTLFLILFTNEYLEEDISIIKNHISEVEYSQIVFFLRKKNGKTRTRLEKEFSRDVEELIFEEIDNYSLEETIQAYSEDYDCDSYIIVYDGILNDACFEEEEPISIEEL